MNNTKMDVSIGAATQQRLKCINCGSLQHRIFDYHGYQYYRCENCALVSTFPLPSEESIRAHYARKFKSGNYQLLRDYSEKYKRVYRGFVQILGDGLTSRNRKWDGLKVLDVGCFTGEFLELLSSHRADVYGLELQSEAVEIASQKFPGRIYQADVNSNIFPQLEFDIVTLLGVIEHVVDPIKLIERSAELLRRDGFLLIQTPNSSSFFARIMRRFWPPYAPVEHIHLFSRRSLVSLLEKMGFLDVQFVPHWKRLPVAYVYQMLQNYGPEFHRLFGPIYNHLPSGMTQWSLPFYIGEMIVMARKG